MDRKSRGIWPGQVLSAASGQVQRRIHFQGNRFSGRCGHEEPSLGFRAIASRRLPPSPCTSTDPVIKSVQ